MLADDEASVYFDLDDEPCSLARLADDTNELMGGGSRGEITRPNEVSSRPGLSTTHNST